MLIQFGWVRLAAGEFLGNSLEHGGAVGAAAHHHQQGFAVGGQHGRRVSLGAADGRDSG
ncbi:MAG: hypothetical protein ACRYFV_01700 [Janthinobacterium lividum]